MDDNLKGFIKFFAIIIVSVLLIAWLSSWISYKWDVCYAESNIVDVYDAGVKIYEGKQAYIKVESGGMTTTLTIYRNLYPHIIDSVYSSEKIRIQPHQEK